MMCQVRTEGTECFVSPDYDKNMNDWSNKLERYRALHALRGITQEWRKEAFGASQRHCLTLFIQPLDPYRP